VEIQWQTRSTNVNSTGSFHFTYQVKDLTGGSDLLGDAIHVFHKMRANFYSFN